MTTSAALPASREPAGNQPAWTEAERIAVLHRYNILDTPPEPAFDDIVRLVASLLKVPIAAVNLIAAGRQWFKAEVGLGVREMPLDNSICARVFLQPGDMTVPDTTQDPRFNCNPLVTGAPGLRFYAGEALLSPEGMPIGTLCALDVEPRPGGLSDEQRFILKTLAGQVMDQLELRRAIAERDRVLVEQHRAEALNRQIIDSVTEYAIISLDLDRRVTSWNTGAEKIFGWTSAEMLGQTKARLVPPDDPFPDGSPDGRRYRRKDGTEFWSTGSGSDLKDETGSVVGFVRIVRDRTKERQADLELRSALGLNAPILNSSADCIVILDLEGNNLFVSPGGLEAMEVEDGNAILGLSWLRVWKEEDGVAARDAVASARSGQTGRFRGFCPTHKGTPKWWDVAISPLAGADGRPERLVSVGRDITATHLAEEALRRSETQLRELNETLERHVQERTRERDRVWRFTNDLMGSAGHDGFLKSVNPAWSRLLGWSEEELLDRPLLALIDPDDHAETAEILRRLSAGQSASRFVDRVLQKDGERRVVMWDAIPDGALFHLVGRDITELRRVEEQFRQSQKMEAVGQLTGGIAHDFNNLLTGISGSLEMLQTRVAQGRLGDIDRYISAGQNASRRAAALTHRLLAFSRRQTLDPRPIDINRLIIGIEEMVRRTVGADVTLEVVGQAGLWTALVDPNQLENALLNLCINARDAMPKGGRITIETANKWLDERGAKERDLSPGQYLSLCVTDTGTGMTPEVIARAFDPFFTTKPIGQGTGLGLSMIYGFAKQSGGQVRIYSELGQGTTMCIYLPRFRGDAEETSEAMYSSSAPHAGQGETVLIVDDEPTVRMLVTDVLHELGYTVLEAVDGAAGLKVLQSDLAIDLLITDVGLPGGLNGRQVADAARVVRPDLKVLFITGYAENAVVGNGHLEPGMHVLTKPFAMDALANRISELVKGS